MQNMLFEVKSFRPDGGFIDLGPVEIDLINLRA
jgi:hypothetical protein